MTEVDYGGGGHCTRLGEINDQLVCLEVPPAPVYKGARGEGRPALEGAPGGGILLLVGVGFPSFLLLLGGGKEGERKKERGAPPPSPSPIRTRGGGARGLPWLAPLSLSTRAQQGPLTPRGFR